MLWIIGDIVADFGDKRAWLLYGPSNTGKSKVGSIIRAAASPDVVSVPVQYIVDKHDATRNYGNTIPLRDLSRILSVRLAVSGDLEIKRPRDEKNIQSIKECTGGDEREVGNGSTILIMYANILPEYDMMSSYTRPNVTRRLVVLPSIRERTNASLSTVLTDEYSLRGLRAAAIRIRACYDMKPPMTVTTVLHTLFSGNIAYALNIIEYRVHDMI